MNSKTIKRLEDQAWNRALDAAIRVISKEWSYELLDNGTRDLVDHIEELKVKGKVP